MTRPDTRDDILSLAAEALKPFAEEAAEWELGYSDDEMIDTENVIRVGDLRRASRVLALLVAPTPPASEAPGQEPPCEYCNGDGDVHTIDGEWRGVCTCPAGDRYRATAPEPGQEPVAYLVEHAHSGPVLSWTPPTAEAEKLGWLGSPLFPAPPTYADAEAMGLEGVDSDSLTILLRALKNMTGLYENFHGHETAYSRDARAAIATIEQHIRALASPAPKGET